jgi:methyl-accepting chemotaxis protein
MHMSGSSGPTPPNATAQAHVAARLKAKEQALERRRQHDKVWMERRVGEIGKGDALNDINTHWQSYTPFEMSLLLNLDEVTQAVEARIMRVATFFESARNMLIIVPIMLTWLSLALAGAAYEGNLVAPRPNGKPFLQQWQEGFAPLKAIHLAHWNISLLSDGVRWFTFANFALTDATLLALILSLTIIGQALEIWAYRRSTRVAATLERHMYSLNSRTLLGVLENAPDAKTPPWLRELRTDLGHLRDVIGKMNTALDDSMDRYTEAITQQKEAVNALVTDTKKIHDSVVQLNTLYQGGAEAARVYKQYIPGVTQDIAKLANTQQRSMNSMNAQVEMLAKSMRYLGEMTNHVREAQATIDKYRDFGGRTTGRTPAYQPQRPTYRPTYPPTYPSESSALPEEDSGSMATPRRGAPSTTDEAARAGAWSDGATSSMATSTEWPQPMAYEPDGYQDGLNGLDYPEEAWPETGFWYRVRDRLSSIPVVRVLVRRPR